AEVLHFPPSVPSRLREAKSALSLRVTLVSSFAVPAESLGVVLWHSLALVIHEAEAILSLRVSLFGGFAIPADSLGVVPRHPFALTITDAEAVLGFRVSVLGAYAVYPRGLGELPLNRFLFVYRPKDCCPAYHGHACYRYCNFPKRCHFIA